MHFLPRLRLLTRVDSINRGELYWVDWSPGRGSEQLGRRPSLIVQNNEGNRSSRYTNTIVVTLSTSGRKVPTHVPIEPDSKNGLSETSYAKCEQVMTISKDRLQAKIGKLDTNSMKLVDRALLVSIGIEID